MWQLSITLLAIGVLPQADSQLAKLFGDASEQKENCAVWSAYGDCIWLRGPKDEVRNPYNRPYFEQLPKVCRHHRFYETAERLYGQAVENAFEYCKELTEDQNPCGQCSYQQSCGFRCEGSVNLNYFNVSERLCQDFDQSHACTLHASLAPSDCKIWPTDKVALTNVPPVIELAIKKIDLINCVPGKNSRGEDSCRCCCTPFKPDPSTFKCV